MSSCDWGIGARAVIDLHLSIILAEKASLEAPAKKKVKIAEVPDTKEKAGREELSVEYQESPKQQQKAGGKRGKNKKKKKATAEADGQQQEEKTEADC